MKGEKAMMKKCLVLCFAVFFFCLAACFASADEQIVNPRIAEAQIAYYYNPDGGQKLHTDPQCKTISSKYWPIMEETTLEYLKEPEHNDMQLCKTCCAEKNNVAAFFKGKKDVEGCFDVTEKAAENLTYYTDCCQYALSFLIDRIGDPLEQYRLYMADGIHWGYPDEDEVSRDMAIAIAYAALQEYIGIGDDVLFQYYAQPWLDIGSYPYHEWLVKIYRATSVHRSYADSAYYFYINADNGLITKIHYY